MIEKIYDMYIVSCDWCSTEEGSDLDFYETIDKIKEEGWRISKKDGEWLHKCLICAGNEDLLGISK